jgi:hypothetical protein
MVVTLAAVACGGSGTRADRLPTAPTDVAAAVDVSALSDRNRAFADFPPRDQALQFRLLLEAQYRDLLRRSPIQTYVDIEGAIVWMQEYLRYRLSGCEHLDAVQMVLNQIAGRGIAAHCGGKAPFPPRNEPFDFRANYLEPTYRVDLRRTPVSTFVDNEGDVVWTTEYLRLRIAGCSSDQATTIVLVQLTGAPPPHTCGGAAHAAPVQRLQHQKFKTRGSRFALDDLELARLGPDTGF